MITSWHGHVFVLLAGASAKQAGHPDADRLIKNVSGVLNRGFWDDERGLFREEYRRDWSALSTYRGMNSNMHGAEAMLAAFEATGAELYLERAGRILDFFVARMAPVHEWRIPEHYMEDWQVDPIHEGDPLFRPAGTTPGHSLEFGRLAIQRWELCGRPDSGALKRARKLIERALADAWLPAGGLCYTLNPVRNVSVGSRYWWPVAEAIGAAAVLLRVDPTDADEEWYRKLWSFAHDRFVDHVRGGWYPEIDAAANPVEGQFQGKPDIYHSLQAALIPFAGTVSRTFSTLAEISERE